MRVSTGKGISFFSLLGAAAVLVAWQIIAQRVPGALPGLVAIGNSLVLLSESGELWRQLSLSLLRALTGLAVGAVLGAALGVVAGFVRPIYYLLKPFVGVLLSSPAVVVVMLAMVWFGVGPFMAIFVTALFTVPIMYVSVAEGMGLVEADLLEMASVYRLPRWNLWWDIYLPALSTAVLTGLAFAAGTAFRKTVMAELLGSNDGIGFAMAMTRFNLDTARLFAWVAVCLVVAGAIQYILITPIAWYLRSWRTVDRNAGGAYE